MKKLIYNRTCGKGLRSWALQAKPRGERRYITLCTFAAFYACTALEWTKVKAKDHCRAHKLPKTFFCAFRVKDLNQNDNQI